MARPDPANEIARIPINQLGRQQLKLGRVPLVEAENEDAKNAIVCGEASGHEESLVRFLNDSPPAFYLETLSRVDGEEQDEPPGRETPEPIAKQIMAVEWGMLGIDPLREKPTTGTAAKSIFEYVEERLLASTADVVFLDDGAGEIADYVSIDERDGTVLVSLFHCKAAKKGAKVPNQQIAGLYEVVGQAVKCRRYLEPRRLAEQLAHRRTLAGCGFRRGDIDLTRKLLAAPYRVEFQVVIVQPSLSTTPSEPICRLLEAADAYMRGSGEKPLSFWGAAET